MAMARGGASLVEREPAFSADGKRLLACSSCSVSVYSVATGLLITQLHGHTATVTGIAVVPIATLSHAWTSSLDGTIRMWDYSTGSLLRTVNVRRPIFSMAVPGLCKRVEAAGDTDSKLRILVAFLSVRWSEEEPQEKWEGRIICHNLTTGKPFSGQLAKVQSPRGLRVSPSGGLVGMLDGRKIWVWRMPAGSFEGVSSVKTTVLHHTKTLSVAAFDVTETRVSGGDETGRILIWENVGERKFVAVGEKEKGEGIKKGSTAQKSLTDVREEAAGVRGGDNAGALTTYHWHSHEVKFLVFSSDGSYLLSGGLEGVLVIWQLESGKRQFLPRLGAPVVHIAVSPDPALFAISCMDNAIKFVNIGTLSIERSIQGIKPPFPSPKELKLNLSRVTVEPQEGKLVLPTHNLSLQFYDAANDQHVSEVQVAVRNYLPGWGNKKGPEGPSTFVTHVAFSADGSGMATVDIGLREQGLGGVACLKFWDRQSGKLQYALNTQVDEPHEIASLVFHPRELMAVSCSHTDFKVWVPSGNNKSLRKSWRCRSVGSYRQRKILAAVFSWDGTVLAVAAAELLTLWNPFTNGLVRVLANPNLSLQHITLLAFVNHSNCLVAASSGEKPQLTVWDLSTLSVLWNYSFQVEAIAVDPAKANFAVLGVFPSTTTSKDSDSKNAVVVLFAADKPSPISYWSVRDGIGGTLLFFPQDLLQADKSQTRDLKSAMSNLAVITKGREFALFNPYNEHEEEAVLDKGSQLLDTNMTSAFTAMYGKASTKKKKNNDGSVVLSGIKGKAPWGDLLAGPSHLLPPLTKMCIPFMESLLRKQTDQL